MQQGESGHCYEEKVPESKSWDKEDDKRRKVANLWGVANFVPKEAEGEDDDDDFVVTGKDLVVTLDLVDGILQDTGATLEAKWPRIRDKLHVLKGDP